MAREFSGNPPGIEQAKNSFPTSGLIFNPRLAGPENSRRRVIIKKLQQSTSIPQTPQQATQELEQTVIRRAASEKVFSEDDLERNTAKYLSTKMNEAGKKGYTIRADNLRRQLSLLYAPTVSPTDKP